LALETVLLKRKEILKMYVSGYSVTYLYTIDRGVELGIREARKDMN